jgi:membrane associated rhomboid family serine protease
MSEYRPGGFQILPPVIKNLIIINVLVFLVANFTGEQINYFFLANFALFHWESPLFKPWQFVTHMFMHGDFMHLFFNMFALWMFGNVIENILGTKKFLIFYFVTGIGAAVCYLAVLSLGTPSNIPMVGASGAIFGILFAFGYLLPNLIINIYFLIPIKAKYFVAIYAAIELFSGLRNNPGDNIAHFAHLGGMLFAFILLRIWGLSSRNISRY